MTVLILAHWHLHKAVILYIKLSFLARVFVHNDGHPVWEEKETQRNQNHKAEH